MFPAWPFVSTCFQVECYDYDNDGSHDLIGTFETTMTRLQEASRTSPVRVLSHPKRCKQRQTTFQRCFGLSQPGQFHGPLALTQTPVLLCFALRPSLNASTVKRNRRRRVTRTLVSWASSCARYCTYFLFAFGVLNVFTDAITPWPSVAAAYIFSNPPCRWWRSIPSLITLWEAVKSTSL